MITVTPIPAFQDNYIWSIEDSEAKKSVIVDPGSANEVLEYLETNHLVLDSIIVTHHHPDHVGGIIKLLDKFPVNVYGSQNSKLDIFSNRVSDNDFLNLLGQSIKVISVPGHTLDHIAFYFPISDRLQHPLLFCGDTLFSGGCGRLFEGSAEQMLESLNKLKDLPDSTLIYCAHEYTLANLDFAKTLMPNNQDLVGYTSKCQSLRQRNTPTIPTTLAQEKAINPFLRSLDEELVEKILLQFPETPTNESGIFAATRKAKDKF